MFRGWRELLDLGPERCDEDPPAWSTWRRKCADVVPVIDIAPESGLSGLAYCVRPAALAPVDRCVVVVVAVHGTPKYIRTALTFELNSGAGADGARDGVCTTTRKVSPDLAIARLRDRLAADPIELSMVNGKVVSDAAFRAQFVRHRKWLRFLETRVKASVSIDGTPSELEITTSLAVSKSNGKHNAYNAAECRQYNAFLRAIKQTLAELDY